eukprot:10545784-Alexandrium_andersonii.AAC.1
MANGPALHVLSTALHERVTELRACESVDRALLIFSNGFRVGMEDVVANDHLIKCMIDVCK